MLSFLRKFFNYRKKKAIQILVWTLISNLTAGVGVMMLVPMLSVMDISSETDGLWGMLAPYFTGIPKSTFIAVLLGLYLILVAIKAVISMKLSVWETEICEDYNAHLRRRMYRCIMLSDWETYKTYKKSVLTNYLVEETERVSYAGYLSVRLLNFGLKAIVDIGIAFCMSIPMTLIVIGAGGIFILLFKKVRGLSRSYGANLQTTSERFMEEATNQMNGLKEIRSYGVEAKQEGTFNLVSEEYREAIIAYSRLSAVPQMVMSVSSAILVVGVFLLSFYGFHMSIARIAVLIYVLGRLWPVFSTGQSYWQQLLSIMPVYEKMEEVVADLRETQHQITDEDVSFDFKEEIRFDDVSFSYADDDSEEELIEHASFAIKAGEITAFVGKSGAGKSTMVDLLLGFLRPTAGRIRIDGKPLDEMGYGTLRKSVSYIPQEPLLLNASIRENLVRFHSFVPSEKELDEVLEMAQIKDLVDGLPQGIDTLIGDQGIRLSGGERQRIVLARALIGHPKLLVLDEATSALDFENEQKIREILLSLKGSLTIVLVAHRPSTIKSADHILVINDGAITEEGTYEELVAEEGYIAMME